MRCVPALIGRRGESCAPADLLRAVLPSAGWSGHGRAIIVAGLIVAGGQGSAGHSVGHFPSYYPDEIRIEAIGSRSGRQGPER